MHAAQCLRDLLDPDQFLAASARHHFRAAQGEVNVEIYDSWDAVCMSVDLRSILASHHRRLEDHLRAISAQQGGEQSNGRDLAQRLSCRSKK